MKQKGFTLIELMVSMSLGMIIVLGITSLYLDSSKTVTELNRTHRGLENSLFATDLISAELALMGYWGEAAAPIDADHPDYGPLRPSIVDPSHLVGFDEVPICVGTGNSGFHTIVELGYAMEHSVASGNGEKLTSHFNSGQCNMTPSNPSNNDFVTIRRASTCAMGVTCPLIEDSYYIQTNGCYDEAAGLDGGEIRIRKLDPFNVDNQFYSLYGCQVPAPMYTYAVNTYYVNTQEQLVRLHLDENNQYVEEMLVEGVEHLSFQWFIDTDGDKEHDYVTTTLTQDLTNKIRGVKIWIVIRGLDEMPEYYDDHTYTIAGKTWNVPESNKHYARILKSHMVDVTRVVDIQRNNGKGGRK